MVIEILVREAVARYFGRGQANPSPWMVTGHQEKDRYAEPIGADTRTLDNSGSDVELSRSLTISNTVERQFKVDLEASSKSGVSGAFGSTVHGVGAKFSAQVEQMVRAGLSASELQKHSVEEKLEFRVPARTVLTITLTWKRIWQRGEVTLQSSHGETFVLPYEESVGVDFDLNAVTSP